MQSNLSIADIPYSGQLLIADNFRRSKLNPGQTLIRQPLLSGHFIVHTSLYRTLFSDAKWIFPQKGTST